MTGVPMRNAVRVAFGHIDEHAQPGGVGNHEQVAASGTGQIGVSVIWQPTFLIGEDLRQGRLSMFPGYHMPNIEVLTAYLSRRHLAAKVRAMIDFLVSAFADTPRCEFGKPAP